MVPGLDSAVCRPAHVLAHNLRNDDERDAMQGTTVRAGGVTARHPAWLRWWMGLQLLFCLGAVSGAWAQQPASSPSREGLLAQQLAPDDPARFAWTRAAEAVGQGADALHLQLALLDDWVLALEGRPAQAGRSIEAAMAHGREMDADLLQRGARDAWLSVLQAPPLRPEWDRDGPQVPLPPE